ncbi:MAG: EamA family transporter RarD [Arcanobacterium sp.]|nr:EamA family transporter RarD [Arcanobacterium sp.]
MSITKQEPATRAWISAILAHFLWGLFPLYFVFLNSVGPLEVIVFRCIFSAIFCCGILILTKQVNQLLQLCKNRTIVIRLAIAGTLIIINWTAYIYAVQTDRTVDAALGYFMNPVLTVALAMIVLKERLSRFQTLAVTLGITAVIYLLATLGTVPWISLVLAGSFGFYGLVKKRIAKQVPAVPGLVLENLAVTPILLGYWIYLFLTNQSSLQDQTVTHAANIPVMILLLIGSGILTAIPLLLFAKAAHGLPLGILGLIQYLSPIMQMLIGVLIFHEHLPSERWIATGIVWLALIALSVDGISTMRKNIKQK